MTLILIRYPALLNIIADVDDTGSILIWSFILIALVVVGFLGALYVKKWTAQVEEPDDGAGFTLGDLRRLHKEGKITGDEFEKASVQMISATRRAVARSAEMAAETAKQRGIPVATDVDQLRARAKRGLSKLSDTTAVPLTASSAPVAESNVDPLAIPSILCGVQGCGHPNPGNAPFCRHCGARLVRSVSHQQDSREAEAENER